MATIQDKNLALIEQELLFIARHSRTIESGGGADFEAVDEIQMAVESALRALHEYQISLRPSNKDAPAGVPLKA
jgi:hypothetical protein